MLALFGRSGVKMRPETAQVFCNNSYCLKKHLFLQAVPLSVGKGAGCIAAACAEHHFFAI